jgi:hypothetical protein
MLLRTLVFAGLLMTLFLISCHSGKIPCPKTAGESTGLFAFKGKGSRESGVVASGKQSNKLDKNGLLKRKKYKHIKRKNS